MNVVLISGRITRDFEPQQGRNSGKSFCCFSIATNSSYGEKTSTEYTDLTAFGKLAEDCARNLRKGDLVFVEGEKQTRVYEKQDGSKGKQVNVIVRGIYCQIDLLNPQNSQQAPEEQDEAPLLPEPAESQDEPYNQPAGPAPAEEQPGPDAGSSY